MLLDFKPIEISMKAMVESYTKPYDFKSSEFTFTNLFIWGGNGDIKIAQSANALFIYLNYGNGDTFMFPPISKNIDGNYCDAVHAAAEHMRELGITPMFKSITGRMYDYFKNCPWVELSEDRDNFDYVYSMTDLRDLEGKKYHEKRNHINRFLTDYKFEYCKLNSTMKDECLAVYDDWVGERDTNIPGVLDERLAIDRLISNMKALNVVGGAIKIENQIVAYSIGERISDEMAVIHIEKAKNEIPGLFQMINQQFVENEFADMKYINREEDMGIPGMRRAKESYHPIMMIEKYIGVPKGECRN